MRRLVTPYWVLFLLFLSGCSSTPQIGSFEESLTTGYVPAKEELWAREQGDKIHAEAIEEGLLSRGDTEQAYLLELESRLLPGNEDYNAAIQVFILRDPTPNAVALPNGVIYLNSGLFTVLESEAQLAAILAHEIAHVTEMHSVKSVVNRKNTMVTAHIADLATGGLGLAYIPAAASLMGYSREHESEADRVGVRLLQSAGYDPNSLVQVFQIFKEMPELVHVENSIYSSHPSQDARIEELQHLIASLDYRATNSAEHDDATFLALKASLMEQNVKTRLQNRQFHLASTIIDRAFEYYSDGGKIAFYRGEVYRGFYRFPVDAAQEKYWIETGDIKRKNEYTQVFSEAKITNLKKAEDAYKMAANHTPPFTGAYKRLGEVKYMQNDKDASRQWFMKYLEEEPNAVDRPYVQRMLERLDR